MTKSKRREKSGIKRKLQRTQQRPLFPPLDSVKQNLIKNIVETYAPRVCDLKSPLCGSFGVYQLEGKGQSLPEGNSGRNQVKHAFISTKGVPYAYMIIKIYDLCKAEGISMERALKFAEQ